NGTAQVDDVTGTTASFGNPPGPTYSLSDAAATYGDIAVAAHADCGGDCDEVEITAASRPVQHWDATIDEALSEGALKTWVLHVGESFSDVAVSEPYYSEVETLLHRGIVAGCAGGLYCPGNPVTRGRLAHLLLTAIEGTGY